MEEEEEEGEQVMAANQTLRGLASNRRLIEFPVDLSLFVLE